MARYLVVAHRTSGSEELARQCRALADLEPGAEFTVVAPAAPVSYWRPWDEMEAHEHSARIAKAAAERLRAAGVPVTREAVGSREPLDAIEDELREHPGYTGIVICTFPAGISRWLRGDLVKHAEERTGLPVTHVVAQPGEGVVPPHLDEEPHPVAPPPPPPRPAVEHAAAHVAPPPRPAPPPHTYLREDDVAQLPSAMAVPADLPPELQARWDMLEEGEAANLYKALRPEPLVLHGYVAFLQATWQSPGIEPELRELVALLVARLRRNTYTWHQHVRIARDMGVAEERIVALEHWRSAYTVNFDDRERAVLGYVEALVLRHDVAGALALVRQHLDEQGVVLVSALAGFASLTAMLAVALGVEPEERFVGWLI